MNFIDRFKFGWSVIDYLTKLIKSWKPKNCKTEKDYEKSLYNLLQSELPHVQVIKQFAFGRMKADIVVDGNIIIEIKNNLKSRSNYQRLIGQLIEYKQWEGSVIILLIGETDSNFIKELKAFIKREDNSLLTEPEKYILVEKK